MEANTENAVAKAVRILSALRVSGEGASARELAPATGLARSTIQRTLGVLIDTGMVIQDNISQRYKIGPQALVIGLGYNGGNLLVSTSKPYMVSLRDETGETVGLSVAVGTARVFLEEVQSTAEIRFASELGRLYPLWSGASGRILLSGLSPSELEKSLDDHTYDDEMHDSPDPEQVRAWLVDVQTRGYAFASNETIADVNSVAVRVGGGSADTLGALSVSGPAGRLTESRMHDIVPLLRTAASKIGESLGAW